MHSHLAVIKQQIVDAESDLSRLKEGRLSLAARGASDQEAKRAMVGIMSDIAWTEAHLEVLKASLPMAEAKDPAIAARRIESAAILRTLSREAEERAAHIEASIQSLVSELTDWAKIRTQAQAVAGSYASTLPVDFESQQRILQILIPHAGGSTGAIKYAMALALYRLAFASGVYLGDHLAFSFTISTGLQCENTTLDLASGISANEVDALVGESELIHG